MFSPLAPQAEKDTKPRPRWFHVSFPDPLTAATIAAAFAAIFPSTADAGLIHWGSKGFVENTDSKGKPWTPSFTMTAGIFTGGFSPTLENREDWLAHWQPLGTAIYAADEMRFAGVIDTQSHPGIATGTRIHFWAKNGEDLTKGPEWLLLNSPAWTWPGNTGSSIPALVWTTGETGASPVTGIASLTESHLVSRAMRPVPISKTDWLSRHLPHDHQNLSDSDGDGLSDTLEYFLGSHPANASSVISPQVEATSETARISLQRNPYAESDYILEASTDLKTWNRVENTPLIDRPDFIETEVAIDPTKPSRFFRFQLQSTPAER